MKLPVFYLGLVQLSEQKWYARYPQLMMTTKGEWRPYDMSARLFTSISEAAKFIWECKEDSSGYSKFPVYIVPLDSDFTAMIPDKDTCIEMILKYI